MRASSEATAQSEFARVYDSHVWDVYAFLAYRIRDRSTAEDLTQATFVRALDAWSRYDSSMASELTWLLAIARNLLIDHHRRDRSDRLQPIDEYAMPAVAGPETLITGGPDLTRALAELSDRERQVLALRFDVDLNGPGIAALTGLTLANVQQIISRSLRKLRVSLEAEAVSG